MHQYCNLKARSALDLSFFRTLAGVTTQAGLRRGSRETGWRAGSGSCSRTVSRLPAAEGSTLTVQLVGLGWRMSLSLHSDSENSSSSDQHGPVFGSARVLPDSPTPYTDATQVCVPLCKLPARHLSCPSCPLNRIPSPLSPSGRHNNFYSKDCRHVFPPKLAPLMTVSSVVTNARPKLQNT